MAFAHPILTIVLALVFTALFFIPEFVENKVSISLLAGIFISYLFLVMIPEIAESLPYYLFENAQFLFIIIGFSIIYLAEVWILKVIAKRSRERMRELIDDKNNLVKIEEEMEGILISELSKKHMNETALREITQKIFELDSEERKIKTKIKRYRREIQLKLSEELASIRFWIFFVYHLLAGFVMVEVLNRDIISGALFFIFAFLVSFILERHELRHLLSDLDIDEIEIHEPKSKKILMGSAALIGSITAIVMLIFLEPTFDLLFILYALIAGVLLFIVVREVIPKEENAKPILFLVGLIGFSILIFILEALTHFIITF